MRERVIRRRMPLTRRDFIGGSSLLIGGALLFGLEGCSPSDQNDRKSEVPPFAETPLEETASVEGGKDMQSPIDQYAPDSDEFLCASLYDDLCSYSMTKDESGLSEILDDSYVLVHMTGMRQSKTEYIEAVADGTLNYYSTQHDLIDVSVSSDGMSASIRGCSRIEAAVFGGSRREWNLQQDIRARRQDGRWILVESRASTYSASDLSQANLPVSTEGD